MDKIDKLKKIIAESEYKSNKEFANAIKMSPSYLSEVLNGKKDIPKYLPIKLEKFMQVNLDWWENDKGEMHSQTNTLPKEEELLNVYRKLMELEQRIAKLENPE